MKGANYSTGKILYGIEDKKAAISIIKFVQRKLPAWRDDPDRSKEESEPKLNQQLCIFLNSRSREEFPMVQFVHEIYQYKSRQVDLAASPIKETPIGAVSYTIYDPLVVFECKRLPAPSAKRKMEYVSGAKKSGGIQRFKLGYHGAKLNLVAMIGYIQKRSAKEWHQEINRWITDFTDGKLSDDCTWTYDERLELFNEHHSTGIATCRSIHKRNNPIVSRDLEIHHIWVNMNARRNRYSYLEFL
jgi:hypothetical protein